MKIVYLKIEVVTETTKTHSLHDPLAIDADEDGYVHLQYKAKLESPMICPNFKIQMEESDEDLLVGGIYKLDRSFLYDFVAIDKRNLMLTTQILVHPKDFTIDITGTLLLAAQACKES